MANTLNEKELLPGRASLALCHVEKGAHDWVVEAVGPKTAACPDCGVLSTARHSSYTRHLKDLPVQGRPVHLKLRVGRWRCRNADCERQIFCQRLARVTHRHARETKRFGEVVQQIAYALGGRPGERLSSRLGLPVSDDTLLRRIKQWAKSLPPAKPIRVVGVDDWAWRKGYGRYGTILVDLKRRKVADLLPECSAAAVEQWLRQHPKIKIISRDRQGSLAEGGRLGAPAAKQVADRFHLIQNLQQAVQGELALQRAHLMMSAGEFREQIETEKGAPAAAELVISKPRQERSNPSQKERRLYGGICG